MRSQHWNINIHRSKSQQLTGYPEELSTNVTVPLRHSVDQQQRRNDAEMAQDHRRHPAFDVRIHGRRHRTPKEPAKTTCFYRSQPRRGKRENRSERKPRQSRAMHDENVWLVMNFRDHPEGRSWRSNDSSGAVVAWQWRNSNASTESEATKSIDSPTTKSERKKHVTSQRKQKPMNEQPNEIYWIIEIMKYRIIETINYRNNEISKYRDNELSNYRNKKNVIKRT